MVTFDSVVRQLEALGISDVLLPFFLIFTIVFAILQRSGILGDKTKPETRTFNVVLSTIMGLVVVIPHLLGKYPAGADVVEIINRSLPNVAVVIVALIMVLLIVGVFGGSPTWVSTAGGFVAIAAFLIVGYIFASAAGWLPPTIDLMLSPDTQALLLVVGVFALIIWFITRNPEAPKTGERGTLATIIKEAGKLFGDDKP